MSDNFLELKELPLFNGVEDFLPKIDHLWYNNQICLNSTIENQNDIKLGTGTMPLDWSGFQPSGTEDLYLQKRRYIDSVHTEKEKQFTEFNDSFKGTPLEEIYNFIKSKFNVGRVRLMKITPGHVMSWHFDSTRRLHYPIKTSAGAIMVIENEARHLPSNTWWITSTEKYHTAFNSSKEDRIHLVACLI
jgi:hypothetical protein